MNPSPVDSAERELLRHLVQGRGVRSKNGENRLRDLVLAAQRSPSVQRLCRRYRIGTSDLCIAFTEMLDVAPRPLNIGTAPRLGPAIILTDQALLETFLREAHRVTHGQTPLQRRLGLVDCGKRHGAGLLASEPKPTPEITRSRLLKTSIKSKLPVFLLCVTVAIIGILIAAYFL